MYIAEMFMQEAVQLPVPWWVSFFVHTVLVQGSGFWILNRLLLFENSMKKYWYLVISGIFYLCRELAAQVLAVAVFHGASPWILERFERISGLTGVIGTVLLLLFLSQGRWLENYMRVVAVWSTYRIISGLVSVCGIILNMERLPLFMIGDWNDLLRGQIVLCPVFIWLAFLLKLEEKRIFEKRYLKGVFLVFVLLNAAFTADQDGFFSSYSSLKFLQIEAFSVTMVFAAVFIEYMYFCYVKLDRKSALIRTEMKMQDRYFHKYEEYQGIVRHFRHDLANYIQVCVENPQFEVENLRMEMQKYLAEIEIPVRTGNSVVDFLIHSYEKQLGILLNVDIASDIVRRVGENELLYLIDCLLGEEKLDKFGKELFGQLIERYHLDYVYIKEKEAWYLKIFWTCI